MVLRLCTRSAVSKSILRGYSTGQQAQKPKPTSDEPPAQATRRRCRRGTGQNYRHIRNCRAGIGWRALAPGLLSQRRSRWSDIRHTRHDRSAGRHTRQHRGANRQTRRHRHGGSGRHRNARGTGTPAGAGAPAGTGTSPARAPAPEPRPATERLPVPHRPLLADRAGPPERAAPLPPSVACSWAAHRQRGGRRARTERQSGAAQPGAGGYRDARQINDLQRKLTCIRVQRAASSNKGCGGTVSPSRSLS